MKVLGIAVLAVAMAIAATSGVWAKGGGGTGTKLQTALTVPIVVGARLGEAEYESRVKKGVTNQKLDVEVDNLTLPVGTVIKVLVNGVSVGTATVVAGEVDDDAPVGSGTGEAKLVLKTPKDAVPAIAKGSTISVRTPDLIVIASGTF